MATEKLIVDKVSDLVPLNPDFEKDKVLTDEDLEDEDLEESIAPAILSR